jgi:class 3 adenylate cyclase
VRYLFGDYEVDSGRFLLLRGGRPVPVEPKPLELLIRLLERHPDAVRKDELLDALWPGTTVTEGSLTRAVGEVRRALRERAGAPGAIRTVRGRGYAIGLDVRIAGDPEATRPAPDEPRAGEHRLAAILSADAVGYSRLMCEDEAATVLMIQDCRAEMSGRIGSRRGRIVDTAGDSILAEFPTALEAVEAAVAIQAGIALLNADLPAHRVMPFRIGLHLGDVRAEADGLYGDGVNIAARLQQLAPAGGLALSGAVHGQVAGKLDLPFEDLGERRLKNIAAPVRVFRAELGGSLPRGARPSEAPATMPEISSSDFVGRGRELAEAGRALTQVLGGQGRVLLLAGEAGIGKTRLAEEVAQRARSQGIEVLWGRCYEGEGRPAFWPWVQVLRGYLESRSDRELRHQMGRGAADVAEVVPEVRVRLPELPQLPRIKPEDARFRLFDSVTTTLKAAAVARPLVVMLDDLHAADESSLRLLAFLAAEMASSRILVVGTYRGAEAEPGTPLGRTLAELARAVHAKQVIRLGGLSLEEASELATSLANSDPSPELVRSIYARTEGNPLFVRELSQWVFAAVEAGKQPAAAPATLPESVRQVIGRRLERLSEACHRTLLAACVIGRDFSLSLLARVEEDEVQGVIDRLDEAEEARIVTEMPGRPGIFRFTHALVRETLYHELRTARRTQLHRRVGEALAAMTADDAERPLAELAHHFSEAAVGGDATKAVVYTRLAADQAERCFAFEEGVLQRQRALDLYGGASARTETHRARLMLELARSIARAGDPDRTVEVLWRVIDQARNARAPEVLGEAAVDLADAIGIAPGTSSRIVSILEEALAGLPEGDSPLRVGLMASLGRWRPGIRSKLYSDAYAMARRLGDPKTLAEWLWVRIDVCRAPHQDAERNALIDERIALAERLGDKEIESRARDSRLEFVLQLADPQAFDREVAVARRLAEEGRTAAVVWTAEFLEGVRALWQGRLEEAWTQLTAAVHKGQRANPTFALAIFAPSLYVLRRFQGRLEELQSAVRDGARQGEFYSPRYRCHLVDLYLELGRDAEAREELVEIARSAPLHREELVGQDASYELALLSEACTRLGDEAFGAFLYDLLVPRAGRYVTLRWYSTLGCASRYLGLLATLAKRYADAEAHFEEALRVERRMSGRPWQAYTLIDYARMLIQRGARGDAEIARRQVSEAIAIAQTIGAPGIEKKARSAERELSPGS